MNYINRFQNLWALSISVRNIYYEYQLMHIFLDNFRQGGKYTAKIESYQGYLKQRKNLLTNKKYLSITYLQNDYLNLDINSGSSRNNERENFAHTKCTFVAVLTILQKKNQKDNKG